MWGLVFVLFGLLLDLLIQTPPLFLPTVWIGHFASAMLVVFGMDKPNVLKGVGFLIVGLAIALVAYSVIATVRVNDYGRLARYAVSNTLGIAFISTTTLFFAKGRRWYRQQMQENFVPTAIGSLLYVAVLFLVAFTILGR